MVYGMYLECGYLHEGCDHVEQTPVICRYRRRGRSSGSGSGSAAAVALLVSVVLCVYRGYRGVEGRREEWVWGGYGI
jgi:hypothetical protein